MTELDTLCERYKNAYAFYVFADDLVVVKYPKKEKYFIRDKCTCLGCEKYGDCKHLKMFSGVWTPDDGNPDWITAELGDILELPVVPERFSTAIIKKKFDFSYPLVCFTVKYKKFSMGIELRNENYSPDLFSNIQKAVNERRID